MKVIKISAIAGYLVPFANFKPEMNPLVTVVCLCYNQGLYVEKALQSIMNQDYKELEVFIVDDGSNDGSPGIIKSWLEKNDLQATCLFLEHNVGNCTAFNKALALSSGKYIIDLAADDVMHTEKVANQVRFFESQSVDTALIYHDARYINEKSQFLNYAYQTEDSAGRIPLAHAISGHCFMVILKRHFICPPSTMFKTEVLKNLGGYDESLGYEDWDIYVRLGREYAIAFQNEVLMDIRSVTKSHGSIHNPRREKYLLSTASICQKAVALCKNAEDKEALISRTRYELRNAAQEGYLSAVIAFNNVLMELKAENLISRLIVFYAKLRLK